MFLEPGCHGRISLGPLADETRQRLAALECHLLEFEPSSDSIVIRCCQPPTEPCLPMITAELVRALVELSPAEQAGIPGGELFLHTEKKGDLVRVRVKRGGTVEIRWARPQYLHARRQPYTGAESLVEPAVQCLNGCVSLLAAEPTRAAQELEALAAGYEGLYPDGEFTTSTDEAMGKVQVLLREMNLDVRLLVARLQQLAVPGSLFGHVEVSSFGDADPERFARVVFEDGKAWIERPALWEEPEARPAPTQTAA